VTVRYQALDGRFAFLIQARATVWSLRYSSDEKASRRIFASFGLSLEHAIGTDIALLQRIGHHAVEDGHFKADGGVADLLAEPAFAILAPPCRVTLPCVLPDQMNLRGADIGIELRP